MSERKNTQHRVFITHEKPFQKMEEAALTAPPSSVPTVDASETPTVAVIGGGGALFPPKTSETSRDRRHPRRNVKAPERFVAEAVDDNEDGGEPCGSQDDEEECEEEEDEDDADFVVADDHVSYEGSNSDDPDYVPLDNEECTSDSSSSSSLDTSTTSSTSSDERRRKRKRRRHRHHHRHRRHKKSSRSREKKKKVRKMTSNK